MERITEIDQLKRKAEEIRYDIVDMIAEAGSGHPGGSLSAADIGAVLFFNEMKYDPQNPEWKDRDKFILSKGHAAPLLYTLLAHAGYFERSELKTLRKYKSRLQGHPASYMLPGVEVSTGSLGQGLSISCGIAMAGKMDKKTIEFILYLETANSMKARCGKLRCLLLIRSWIISVQLWTETVCK